MKQILVVILLIVSYQSVFAQDEPVYHQIDKSEWKDATDGLNYFEEPDKPEKPERNTQLPDIKTPEPKNTTLILQILGYTLIIVLLVFILLKLFGKGIFGNKKVDPVVVNVANDLDERPMETDLERYLREALERGDYRMAIRIYYLMVLKALHDSGKIEWRKEKTNRDYLTELYQHPDFHRLSNTTLIFEYVWYGERKVDNSQFQVIKPGFTDLIQKFTNS